MAYNPKAIMAKAKAGACLWPFIEVGIIIRFAQDTPSIYFPKISLANASTSSADISNTK